MIYMKKLLPPWEFLSNSFPLVSHFLMHLQQDLFLLLTPSSYEDWLVKMIMISISDWSYLYLHCLPVLPSIPNSLNILRAITLHFFSPLYSLRNFNTLSSFSVHIFRSGIMRTSFLKNNYYASNSKNRLLEVIFKEEIW